VEELETLASHWDQRGVPPLSDMTAAVTPQDKDDKSSRQYSHSLSLCLSLCLSVCLSAYCLYAPLSLRVPASILFDCFMLRLNFVRW